MIPTSGVVGTQVTLSFTSVDSSMRGPYIITWNNTPVAGQGEPVVLSRGYLSNGTGSFTTQVTIPESACGNYFITFQPEGSATHTNFQFNLQPDFKVNPASAKPGDAVQLIGTGFPANEKVSILLNNVAMYVSVTANMKGSFYQAIKMPVIEEGQYKLVASNDNSAISKSVALQVLAVKNESEENTKKPDTGKEIVVVPQDTGDTLPPPLPVPQSPMGNKIGYIGDQTVTFKWSDVFDSSGVRYILEIMKDTQTSTPVLMAKDLSVNFYAASIKPGTYYWRVKAIDGAGNESEWYVARYAFQVSEVSILWAEFADFMEHTRIFIILLWAIAVYILTSIVIYLIRKMKKWQNK